MQGACTFVLGTWTIIVPGARNLVPGARTVVPGARIILLRSLTARPLFSSTLAGEVDDMYEIGTAVFNGVPALVDRSGDGEMAMWLAVVDWVILAVVDV